MSCMLELIQLVAAVNGAEVWVRMDQIDGVMRHKVESCAVQKQAGSVLMSSGEIVEICNVRNVVDDWEKTIRTCRDRR